MSTKKLKHIRFVVSLIVCAVALTTPIAIAYALPPEQTDAIQQLLDDAVRISGTPAISAAVVSDNETHYFNAGHMSRNNRSDDTAVNQHTLYEIGSLSKAFTAVGILLLEEQGLLDTTNPITTYLPWFDLTYRNESVPVTIQQLLNHTSGLSDNHQGAIAGEGADVLRQTAELFLGARLDFTPGSAFAYSNASYIILGLIIEVVSGQSYETFMSEQVFRPLGLHETFLYHSQAVATGNMAQGHRHAFFMTFAFDAPIHGGMKPTGLIISSAHDMARWMGIHLGLVQDIPDSFLSVMDRVRQVDRQGPTRGSANAFYANGWGITLANSAIYAMGHAGQTPSFLANVVLFNQAERGVVFLSNGSTVDFQLVGRINHILNGDLEQSYSRSARQLMDMIQSGQVIFLGVYTVCQLVFGIKNTLKYKPVLTRSKLITMSIGAVAFLLATLRLLLYPATTGGGADWAYIIAWSPPMAMLSLLILPIFLASATWYAYTKNPKPRANQKK